MEFSSGFGACTLQGGHGKELGCPAVDFVKALARCRSLARRRDVRATHSHQALFKEFFPVLELFLLPRPVCLHPRCSDVLPAWGAEPSRRGGHRRGLRGLQRDHCSWLASALLELESPCYYTSLGERVDLYQRRCVWEARGSCLFAQDQIDHQIWGGRFPNPRSNWYRLGDVCLPL